MTFKIILRGIIAGFFGMIIYPFFSGNLVHKIMGLKVINLKTGLDQTNALEGGLREFLKMTLGYLIIPVLWLIYDKENQNIYDKITNTIVVKQKK